MLLNCGAGEDSWEPLGLARRSNQCILKEISPEYSLEGLMLKLRLQYFGKELTHWKRPWCYERLKAGGEGDDRGWDGWMASLPGWTWVWVSSRSWWWTGKSGVLQSMGSPSQTWLSNWTELTKAEWKDLLLTHPGDSSERKCLSGGAKLALDWRFLWTRSLSLLTVP